VTSPFKDLRSSSKLEESESHEAADTSMHSNHSALKTSEDTHDEEEPSSFQYVD
jgi:hypothetical protein